MKITTDQDKVGPPIRAAEIGIFFLVTVVLELLQGRFLPFFLQPKWALIFVIYFSWYSSPSKGASLGILFGLVEDYLLGIFVGLNGLSKTLLGFCCSYISRYVGPFSGGYRVLLIFGLVVVDDAIVCSVLWLLGQPFPELLTWQYLVKSILTGVVGELVFRIYDGWRFPPTDFRRI